MSVELQHNYPLKNLTSFKIGGNAKSFYTPKSIEELVSLLSSLDSFIVMGNWSNVLVSSDGIDENVISTKNIANVVVNGNKVIAQCGIKGPMLSQTATENNLTGFEFMSGFPGSLGGNIYMNASASGQAISDRLISVNVYDVAEKKVKSYKKSELNFSYRTSILQSKQMILLDAEFELDSKPKNEIEHTIVEILDFRKQHQPNLSTPNAGSVFRNPENASAGALLDKVGAKQFSFSGAKVWEKHANFIVNPNKDATSLDVLELMLMMQNAVKDKFGITLKPEVKYLGNLSKREGEICNILYSQK